MWSDKIKCVNRSQNTEAYDTEYWFRDKCNLSSDADPWRKKYVSFETSEAIF